MFATSAPIGLSYLPNELLLPIITEVCQSKENYRMLLLLDHRIHDLVAAADILPKLPVRINTASVAPFKQKLTSSTQFANSIRHLWINGPTFKRMGSAVVQDIIMGCPQLVSLACTTSMLYIVCETIDSSDPDESPFKNLRELTLFAHDYTSWQTLQESAANRWITPQITHLRLQYRAPPDFAELEDDWFLDLTHYAISITQSSHVLTKKEFKNIFPRKEVQQIVLTTYEKPEEVNKEVLEWDDRIRYVFYNSKAEAAVDEFSLWAGRATGRDSIWSKGTRNI